MITGKNQIGYNLSCLGTKTFKTFNPQLNTENKTVFYEANQAEINQAITVASEAFKTFRTLSGKQKASFFVLLPMKF